MPRRRSRGEEVAPQGVPAELYDLDAAEWQSVNRVQKWLDVHGLTVSTTAWGLRAAAGPRNRYVLARNAWLLGNGFHSERWPKLVDGVKASVLKLPRADATEELLDVSKEMS